MPNDRNSKRQRQNVQCSNYQNLTPGAQTKQSTNVMNRTTFRSTVYTNRIIKVKALFSRQNLDKCST